MRLFLPEKDPFMDEGRPGIGRGATFRWDHGIIA
jgi:hypothetical protein